MLPTIAEKFEELYESRIIIKKEAYLSVDKFLDLFNYIGLPFSTKHLKSFWINCPQTLDILGNWERNHNPFFIYSEFVKLKGHACPIKSNITARELILKTKAIGIKNITGKNGGVFLQIDVAFDVLLKLNEQINEYATDKHLQLIEERDKLVKEYDAQAKLN